MSVSLSKARLAKIIALFFLFAVFLKFIMPVWDVDFSWHLKTGEYIFQNHEIPKTDPFTNASDGSLTEKFILSQYWFAQFLFYLLYSGFGPIGIVLMRALILTGIISILWFSMKRTPVAIKALVLYFVAMLFISYAGERPQLFSFLFALTAVSLLEHYRSHGLIKPLFFLPPLMLLWANMHGGFIMGDVLIAVVCTSETFKYFFLRRHNRALTERQLLVLLGTGLASILISYVNPNTYYAFSFALGGVGSSSAPLIREYMPPLNETWGSFVNRNNFIYWSVMGYILSMLALNLRKPDITHLILIFFTLALSLTAVRFVPFFLMTGLLIIGSYSSGFGELIKFRYSAKTAMILNVVVLVMILIWAGNMVKSFPGFGPLSKLGRGPFDNENAVRFIESNIAKANIFNSHNTGSYLVLRLYPRFKAFIDTRSYNPINALETDYISNAIRSEGDGTSLLDAMGDLLPKDYGSVKVTVGKPTANTEHGSGSGHSPTKELWRELLVKHDIDMIVQEATNYFSGDMYALPLRLIKENDWKLVYLDGKVLIFVRDIPRFKHLISKFTLDKNKVIDEIGMENAKKLGNPHTSVYSSLAFALLVKGNADNVVHNYIKQALYLDPRNSTALYLEAYLVLKERKKHLSAAPGNISGPIPTPRFLKK